MKKKLLIILSISSLIIHAENSLPQCNDKYIQLLEKQNELLKTQTNQQAEIKQLLALQLQLKTALLEEERQKEQIMILHAKAQANKAWYEKTWDIVTPAVQNAIFNFIVSAIASKIINGGISLADKATGDWLAENGYTEYAIYAGTFIASDSLQQYFQKRHNKIILSDREMQHYKDVAKMYKEYNLPDIIKGAMMKESAEEAKLARLGKYAPEWAKVAQDNISKDFERNNSADSNATAAASSMPNSALQSQ